MADEKKKLKVDPQAIVKGGVQMVAGLGVSTVAYYAVKAVTPPVLHPVEKVVFKLGAGIFESLTYTLTAKAVGDRMDEISKETDEMLDAMEERQAERKEKKKKLSRREKRKQKEAVLA